MRQRNLSTRLTDEVLMTETAHQRCRLNQFNLIAMSTKILKIEGNFEVWGFFLNGTLVKTKRLLIPFRAR